MTRIQPTVLHPRLASFAAGQVRGRWGHTTDTLHVIGFLLGLVSLLWSGIGHAERPQSIKAYPTLRLELGVAGHIAPEAPAQFGLNVNGGALLMLTVGTNNDYRPKNALMLLPEIGYSYDTIPAHTFSAGLGLGYGEPNLFAAITPRFLVGQLYGEQALGMRTGLAVHVFAFLSLELSYQFLHTPSFIDQVVGLNFGVNFARCCGGPNMTFRSVW